MERLLSPREAAALLGITPDTLRRWEREGRIQAEWTPGGQRRYREADVKALLGTATPRLSASNARSDARAKIRTLPSGDFDADSEAEDSEPAPVKPQAEIPAWERRVKEERAKLEITKIQREREAILRNDREAEEIRTDAEERARDAAPREEQRAREAAAARKAEHQRLEGLRAQGRNMCLLAPSEYQARVTRDLESFVNPQQFPPALNDYTAYQFLRARVDQILKPLRDEKAREEAAQDEERSRRRKINTGMLYANTCTSGWDYTDAQRARAEIQDALEDEVTHEWTDTDLHDLVHEILADWEEE